MIVPEGITLTIGNGTTVHFLKPRESDVNSNEIAEIVVRDRGTLDIGTDVTFTSAHERKNQFDVAADDQENEDHGLIVEGRGIVTIEGLTFYDGTHTLSGEVTVGGDLIVGDGTNAATLRLEAGTEVRFAASDAESDGQDPGRVELIVENSGVLQAGAGNITFRSSNDADDASRMTDWYGIRVAASGIADLSGATIRDGRRLCAVARRLDGDPDEHDADELRSDGGADGDPAGIGRSDHGVAGPGGREHAERGVLAVAGPGQRDR